MKLWDYHIHLENGPYTLEWMDEFFDKAKCEGLIELGFSEHGYRFKECSIFLNGFKRREEWVKEYCTEAIDDYIELVEKAKRKGYPVKLGIEMDYAPEHEESIKKFLDLYDWDYVIGGIHWINEWGFDIPEMEDEWQIRDINLVYIQYFQLLINAIESGIFDIIAHPDVIKVFGHRADINLDGIYEDVINSIKANNICLEISTAGYRKPVNEIYPAEPLIKKAGVEDLPIIINSDAHYPQDVGKSFYKALNLVKKYNLNRICRFDKRKRIVTKIT